MTLMGSKYTDKVMYVEEVVSKHWLPKTQHCSTIMTSYDAFAKTWDSGCLVSVGWVSGKVSTGLWLTGA